MTDIISLENVILPVRVGAVEEERRIPQPIEFTLRLGFDAQTAGRSDRLADTINYVEVYRLLESITGHRPFVLLESICEEVADALLQLRIRFVSIKAHKVRCPIPGMLGKISVEIYRERKG